MDLLLSCSQRLLRRSSSLSRLHCFSLEIDKSREQLLDAGRDVVAWISSVSQRRAPLPCPKRACEEFVELHVQDHENAGWQSSGN